MKAVQYSANSQDLNELKFISVPKPTLQPGYAVVKIYAAAINPIDDMVCSTLLSFKLFSFVSFEGVSRIHDGILANASSLYCWLRLLWCD